MIGALWRRLRQGGRRTPPGCRACGVCCEVLADALQSCTPDLARWRSEGRVDLLARVGPGGELWVDPATGEREPVCPFLDRLGRDRALCAIHHTKPDICLRYPTPVHGGRCLLGTRFDRS